MAKFRLKRIGKMSGEVSALTWEARLTLGCKNWLTSYGKAYDFMAKHEPEFVRKTG